MSPLEKQPTFLPTLGSSPSWTNVLGFYGFNPFNKGPTWRRGMTVECGGRHLSWDTPVWMGSWLSWIIVFQHGNWNSPSFSKGPSWKIHEHHHLDGGYPLSILYQKEVLISWDVRIGHQWPLWRMRCCSVDHRGLVTFLVSHHSLKTTPWELDKRRQSIRMWYFFSFFTVENTSCQEMFQWYVLQLYVCCPKHQLISHENIECLLVALKATLVHLLVGVDMNFRHNQMGSCNSFPCFFLGES